MREVSLGLGAALALVSVAGCGKREQASAGPVASALAASTADAGAGSWRYAIEPAASTHVDMQGVKERIRADTTAATGTIEIVPRDLGRSRGTVRVDLATLTMSTFHNDDDATQTRHARTWLEVEVGGKTNESMRWAEFAIRSIDGLSASDVTAVPPQRQGQEDVRTVTMTVHGELLVHGHTVADEDAVVVEMHYPAGAPADSQPTRVVVKSQKPMRVVLKEVDVRPRDPAGIALSWTTSLVSKVAEVADVTLDLGATPAP